MDQKERKKSRKERDRELRDDGLKKGGGVNFNLIVDRQVGDRRHERERDFKEMQSDLGVPSTKPSTATSSTYDAFKRLAAGLDGRTLAQKIADPNRPTWESYKKDNESKLDMGGAEVKKMIEYRAELDRERESRLVQTANKRSVPTASDSDSEDEDEDINNVAGKGKSDATDESGNNSESTDSSAAGRRKEKKKKSKKSKKKHRKSHKN